MRHLKVTPAAFPRPVLIALMSVLRANPHLVDWFNPSISLVHGLVSVTDKRNAISRGLAATVARRRRRCGGDGDKPRMSGGSRLGSRVSQDRRGLGTSGRLEPDEAKKPTWRQTDWNS